MKKFQFRLQTILDVRRKREEVALGLLADAQRKLQAELNNKTKLMQTLEKALLRRERLSEKLVSSLSYQTEQTFIVGTKQRLIQANQAISRANRALQKAMQNYLNAKKQTMVIEKLEEKQKAEFKKQVNKREQKELDDLVLMRFGTGDL